jgi:uncharacterized OsmC-like protein
MSDEKTHHVTVRLESGMAFVASFDDIPGAPAIRFDEPEPLGGNQAPNAAAVLGAAVGNCLAASLAFCLRRARVDLQDLTAHVTTHVARNDKGRFRVRRIDVELTPVLGAGEMTKMARCEGLFEDFCIVTASVQHGIPVQISLKQPAEAAA